MTIGLGQGILVRMGGELGIAKVLAVVQVRFPFPHNNRTLAHSPSLLVHPPQAQTLLGDLQAVWH